MTLKCIKLYLTNFQKTIITVSMKMCCLNIHLTVNSLTFENYYIGSLLYIIATHNLNKMLYNKVLFGVNFTDVFEDFANSQNPSIF